MTPSSLLVAGLVPGGVWPRTTATANERAALIVNDLARVMMMSTTESMDVGIRGGQAGNLQDLNMSL